MTRVWEPNEEVHIPRIDFTGRVLSIVPTPDPVVTLRAPGGATLTMRGSALERECAEGPARTEYRRN